MHKRDIAIWGSMLAAPAQAADPGVIEWPIVAEKGSGEAEASRTPVILRAAPSAGPAMPAGAQQPGNEAEAQGADRFRGSRPIREWPQAWML